MKNDALRWTLLVTANVVIVGVLCFQRNSGAAAPPFKNSVQQREEMLRELQEIKALLKEQNTLLQQSNNHEQPRSSTR